MIQNANDPLAIILMDYNNYLESAVSKNSLNNYKNVSNIFQTMTEDNNTSDAAKHFLHLLPKLLVKGNEGIVIIERLIGEIKNNDFKILTSDNNKSYLNKFFNFIRNLTNNKKNQYKMQFGELSFTREEEKIINRNEVYKDKQLEYKFRSRLRTQDRVSGDKMWLPLRYISKIYNRAVKFNKIERNLFNEWIEEITQNIYVHYIKDIEGNREEIVNSSDIRDAKLSKIDALLLIKDTKSGNKYEVLINIKDKNSKVTGPYPVVTPTDKGNRKDYMKVKSIRDIAIDHVTPIDSILREKEDSLPMLKMVSNSYKDLQEKDELDEDSAIGELLVDNNFDLEALRKDLDAIKGTLRLMEADYNTRKSNGETYIKVLKKGKKYVGILDEQICNGDEEERDMCLYQKLEENGKTRICKSADFEGWDEVDISRIKINLI
jgi:hypothetical protein